MSIMAGRACSAVTGVVLFVVKDPEYEARRFPGNAKDNDGRSDLPTFSYRVIGELVGEPAAQQWEHTEGVPF
jgi:hypothetical protein